MPVSQQAKILRVLQNREVRRIGGHELISVDVRFIAATNKPVNVLLEDGAFRQDLFYRLNAGHLHIPPLREREGDIVPIAHGFAPDHTFAPEVIEKFLRYPWPGNVRELKNVVQFAVAVSGSSTIGTGDLPKYLRDQEETDLPRSINEAERDLIYRTLVTTHNNKREAARILMISRSTLYEKIKKYGMKIDDAPRYP
jgi:DNA-binding NtrC family response regulator